MIFLITPQRGMVALARRRARQALEFAQTMLTIHLLQHQGRPEAHGESHFDHLLCEIRWKPAFAAQVVRFAERSGMIERSQETLILTDSGRTLARPAMVC